jgi:hypothetical protein
MKMRKLNNIILYDEGPAQSLKVNEIVKYLITKLPDVKTESRRNPFYPVQNRIAEYARKIASIKIQDVTRRIVSGQEALSGEIEYEKRRILGETRAFGILYDGLWLQKIFWDLILREERSLEFVHIFFTNRLFATWDEHDMRYHARVSVYGIPSIISTTGIIEAPAKPREYYLLKQQYEMLRKDPLELKDRFKGRLIDHEDERLTEVTKGYVMQAVFYCLIGDPFCGDRGCRLYNAHWQEDLIYAQLGSKYEFCAWHTRLMDNWNEY